MTDDRKPTWDEPVQRTRDESRDGSTPVLVQAGEPTGGGYAYHDMNTDGRPLCGAGDQETEYMTVTIDEARRHGKSPCQRCRQLPDLSHRE